MISCLHEPPTQSPSAQADRLGEATASFEGLRPRLLGIARRILGDRVEADDLVQEVWLRWQACDRTVVRNPTAFLVTTTTRLAINAAQTARVRHESYVGRWLPEPVATNDDPAVGVERSEALGLGVSLLFERLAPTERAAFVLREAFDYPYPRIATILQVSEANARQLVSRAGKHIASERRRPVDAAHRRRVEHAFVDAARRGAVAALEHLLASDVTSCRPARSLSAPGPTKERCP